MSHKVDVLSTLVSTCNVALELGCGYVYILYMLHEDAMFAILCMGLPITATLANEYLKS